MMASTTSQAVCLTRGGTNSTAKRVTPVSVAAAPCPSRSASSFSRATCRLSSKSALGGLEAATLTVRPALARSASRVAHAAVAAGKKVLIVNTPAGAHGALSDW